MTDNDIIDALEEMAEYSNFLEDIRVAENALDLINRQKAEIERLSKQNGIEFDKAAISTVKRHTKHIEKRAIKEYETKLLDELKTAKKYAYGFGGYYFYVCDDVLNAIKKVTTEKVGANNGNTEKDN